MVRLDRYRRQTALPEIGAQGQRRLASARVVVVGLGALGSVAADLLVRAGVGHLRLVDRDVVELTNLQRQTLFSEEDIDRPKAEAAAERLKRVNASIALNPVVKDVHAGTVAAIMDGADVLVDGTDNFETRHLLNEATLEARVPFVYGGALGTYGMVFSIRSPLTACFRCLNPTVPTLGTMPTCETAGILNSVSAQVGAIQAGEALRLVLGKAPSGDLLVVDGWRPEIQRIHVAPRKDCPACVRGEREFLGMRRAQILASLCGRDTVSLEPPRRGKVDLDGIGRRLGKLGHVHRAGSVLVADVEGQHITLFPDGRALIRGVNDAASARAVYARYVGA